MKKLSAKVILLLLFCIACSDEATIVDPVDDNECVTLICESPQFSSFVKTENVIYGINSNAHKMTIYEPENDSRDARPMILLLSGGGYTSIDLSRLAPLAQELVKYGFVVAAVSYRTGDASQGIPYASRLIEAGQDSKAAVRYMRKEASTWRIDQDFIIIGGWSAGGITTLSHAYITEGDINPDFVDLVNDLGGLEGNQGNNGFSSSTKGVISLAGALINANEVIEAGELPLFAVHGSNDSTIPNTIYGDSGSGSWYGSSPLVSHATSLSIPAEVFIIENGGHSSPVDEPEKYITPLVSFLRSIE